MLTVSLASCLIYWRVAKGFVCKDLSGRPLPSAFPASTKMWGIPGSNCDSQKANFLAHTRCDEVWESSAVRLEHEQTKEKCHEASRYVP